MAYRLLTIDVMCDSGHVEHVFIDHAAPGSTIGDLIDAGTFIEGPSRYSEWPLVQRRPLHLSRGLMYRHVYAVPDTL